ncbi:MAG: hypothetical protein SF028_00445 [Candidatus Sumerlaeia bacterium]|nr:hypothetical protein [Candidatus Sumerlaeia bacterium]
MMFASAKLNIIGTGFLTEPMFYTFLSAMALATVLILERGFSWRWILLFGAGAFLAQSIRYEAWPVAFLFIALMAWPFDRLHAPKLLAAAAMSSVFPAFWLFVHWSISGDPLHFLQLTREHFALNVAEGSRLGFALRLWAGQELNTVFVWVVAVPVVLQPWRSGRAMAFAAIAIAALITVLNAKGAGGFAFPERFWLSAYVLAIPVAAARLDLGVRSSSPSLPARLPWVIALFGISNAVFEMRWSDRPLVERWDYDAMREAIRAVRADPMAEGQRTLVWMDSGRGGFHQILPNLQVPGRWETLPIPTDSPLLDRDAPLGPRVVLVERGSRPTGAAAERAPEPFRTKHMPWDVYLFTNQPVAGLSGAKGGAPAPPSPADPALVDAIADSPRP